MDMNEETKDKLHNVARETTKVLGTDVNPISLEDRVNMTPINDVEWRGLRGQSFCEPTDIEMKALLSEYGVKGIQYSLSGEPDFSDVAVVKAKISDMTKDLRHDRKATMERLLKTDWAKEKDILDVPQMEKYLKDNNLTIHESLDGVTEYIIDKRIHSFFRHTGGRALYRKFENPESGRLIKTKIKQGIVYTGKATNKIVETTQDIIDNTKENVYSQTERFISGEYKQIHKSGVNEAVDAAIFTAVFSTTKNTIAVIKGEESKGEAFKDILYDTSAAATLGYVTGVVKETFNISKQNDAALLVNGTIQISKLMVAYAKGDLDEMQLVTSVAETSAMLAAAYVGKIIGSNVIPIPYVGAYIGEMITTAICAEVISTIKFSKEFDKQNRKIMSLYRKAEHEIRESQARLELIIQKENNELISVIKQGFEEIIEGIKSDASEQVEKGLLTIGSKFGLSEADLNRHVVTKDNLFKDVDEIIVIE